MLFISNYWKLCGKMQFWEEKVAKQALFLMNSLQKKGKNNLAKVQLSIKNTYIGKMLKSLRLYWPLISILLHCCLKFLSMYKYILIVLNVARIRKYYGMALNTHNALKFWIDQCFSKGPSQSKKGTINNHKWFLGQPQQNAFLCFFLAISLYPKKIQSKRVQK